MRYCYWRLETDASSKTIKKPYGYDEFQGIIAKGWQDSLLSSFADALACQPPGYNIGFYIEPPYVAIDLDNKDDELTVSIVSRVKHHECYFAPSVSGNGYHIVGTTTARIPFTNREGIEIYYDKRFIAATEPVNGERCDVDITAFLEQVIYNANPAQDKDENFLTKIAKTLINESTYKAAIAALHKCNPDDSYEAWMRSITAIANSFTGTPHEADAIKQCVKWSKRSSKYDAQALMHIRRYFAEARTLAVSDKPRVTIGTLFHEHPECAPERAPVKLEEEFEPCESEVEERGQAAVMVSDGERGSELGALSYVHDVGAVVREFRAQGIFSVGGREFFRHDGNKWVQLEGDFNRVLHLTKEFIVAKRYNWYRGKGGMAVVEVDCVKGHGVLAQVLREHLAVDNSFPLNSWMSLPSVEAANYLPVKNGIVEITANGVRLLPSNTGFFNLSLCTANYIEDCPLPKALEAGLLRTFNGERAAVEMWYNVMGLCLLNNVFAKKLILVQGASNAGKGQLTELLALLVGETAYTTTNEAALTGAFALADLDRAAVCVIDELDTSYMSRTIRNTLKLLTSGGMIPMNQKMMRMRNAYVTAKVVITTNDTIEALRDPHGGLRQRLVCFNVTRVEDGERVYNWARTIWQQEGAAILFLAAQRAAHILREGVDIIRTPEGSSKLMMEDIEEASIDSIVHWLRNKYRWVSNGERGIAVTSVLASYLSSEHEKSSEHKYWMSLSKVWQGRQVSKKILEAFPKAVIKRQNAGMKVYGLTENLEFNEGVGE
jgi:hypothetical protein